MANASPTVLRRKLGKELRRLREARKMTQEGASDATKIEKTTISKIETGDRNVPGPHLEQMIGAYKVSARHAATLRMLASQARQRGWWEAFGEAVPPWFVEYVGLETAAQEVWTYEAGCVPGLLQAREYTEALVAGLNKSALPSDNGGGLVGVRTARQQRLTGRSPLVLRAVIDEGALRRVVGGAEVMRGQFARLREAVGRPNITVQILPFSIGSHPGVTGPFTVLRFTEAEMNTVFIEIRGDAIYRDNKCEVKRHEADFEMLTTLAIGRDRPDLTIQKLGEIEKEVL